MIDVTRLRALALSFPETTEQPHFGIPTYRVRGKIFATVPDDEHVRVRVDESEIRAAAADHPDCCAECLSASPALHCCRHLSELGWRSRCCLRLRGLLATLARAYLEEH